MKKNVFLLLTACLLGIGQAVADNVLTVSDVDVPQGGQATIEVGCEFDTEYTAFELQIALPDGLSLLKDDDGYPVIEKAFDTNHILSGNLLPSNGNYKITCRSMDNISIPTDGALFRVAVIADGNIELGSNLAASITASEFTRTADSKGENLDDVDFAIHVTEFRTVLDETSTAVPTAEANANVRVKRTVKANEWSTLCLPFAMTAVQCKEAFGDDVELADFTGCDVDDMTGDIQVNFSNVTAIEANHPYIIKVSAPVTEFTVDGVDIAPEDEPSINKDKSGRRYNSFIGTYVAETVIPDYCLFLSDNQFWFSTGKTKMKAFRAYFDLDAAGAEYDDAEVAARITMAFDEGETTGIRNLTPALSKGEGVYYNLKGQQVAAPSKGLYIKDGKKMVVK